MDRLEQFIEYAKLHLISLEQDAEKLTRLLDQYTDDYDLDEQAPSFRDLEIEDIINTGEMTATSHLLSVATDILESELSIRLGE
jgi:pheromone shutdown protein TraB